MHQTPYSTFLFVFVITFPTFYDFDLFSFRLFLLSLLSLLPADASQSVSWQNLCICDFLCFFLIFSFWFCSFPSFQWCQQMHASPWVGKTSKNRIQATKSFLQTCLSSDTETSGKLLQTLSVAQQTTFKNCPHTVASNNAMCRSSRPKLQLVWQWMLAALLPVKGGQGAIMVKFSYLKAGIFPSVPAYLGQERLDVNMHLHVVLWATDSKKVLQCMQSILKEWAVRWLMLLACKRHSKGLVCLLPTNAAHLHRVLPIFLVCQ